MPKRQTAQIESRSIHEQSIQAPTDVLNHYAKKMTEFFGDTTLPAVRYKGKVIPRRVLSDYSYLTSRPEKEDVIQRFI